MAGFEEATKVAAGVDATTFTAQVDPQWTVIGNPNGGYLLAILARAAATALDDVDHPHPVAASASFLATPAVGPATVTVERMRSGRTVSQVRARFSQEGRHCIEALLTMGRLDPTTEPYWFGDPPPSMPDPEDCVHLGARPPGADVEVAMHDAVDVRLDPAGLGYLAGEPDGSGELRGWFGFADDLPPDPVNLLFVADALPPASLTINPSGWVPTLELTVYVRAVPAPGRLLVRQRARLIQAGRSGSTPAAGAGSGGPVAGMMDEVCDIWDSRGRLVAQATQLASVRFRA
jgi:acyl-coenzyme A thioesterase PaaI-like protein